MTRTQSPVGRAFLEREEGVVGHWYRDVARFWTAGMGHKWRSAELDGPEPQDGQANLVSHEQVDAWADEDIAKDEAAVNAHVTVNLSQNAFDACCSLVHNIGAAGFATSTVLRVINGSTEMPLADAWELWDKDVQNGVKVVDAALLARRKREVALYLTPDAAIPPDLTGALANGQPAVVLPEPLGPDVAPGEDVA